MEAFNSEDATASGCPLYRGCSGTAAERTRRLRTRCDPRDKQAAFAADDLAIELEDLETRVEGDLGYKAGRYRVRTKDGELVDRGKYIEIWSKVDGQWLLHRDIWNSSLPPPKRAKNDQD